MQVYVSLPQDESGKEYRRLAGFAKTKLLKPGEKELLKIRIDRKTLAYFSEEQHAWIAEKGYHTGNIMNAFRLTLVGEGKGPHMFDISWVLGKEETLARMKRAVEVLK